MISTLLTFSSFIFSRFRSYWNGKLYQFGKETALQFDGWGNLYRMWKKIRNLVRAEGILWRNCNHAIK
ncbi:hypothetical protein CEXT_346981 [Caerostris extrusa]|uniref:Uncharacterized protein n=1 Tax=Caerostris extrusa TaxID=172846 RepID=A0AAV4QK14_CAEEX|nr:hypothetical protein CEXT_346981 [Caerostris extrusa]